MTRLLLAAVFILVLFVPAAPAVAADAVVGTGTTASCTEAAFDTALATVQNGSSGAITFNCGGSAAITFKTQKTISKSITIQGGNLLTLSGGNSTRLFLVGGALNLQDITLTNGLAADTLDGGAIFNAGELNLTNTTIRNSNTGSNFSGGAIVSYGPVTITNSLLENNSGGNAGALYLRFPNATATLVNSTLRNNHTSNTNMGWGGAILLWDGASLIMHNTIVANNQALTGGGINNSFSNSNIHIDSNSSLTGNLASISGGGIYSAGPLILTNVSFSDNQATNAFGGGIYSSAPLTLTNVTLSNNTSLDGGGIANKNSAYLKDVLISGNTTSSSGAGMDNTGTASLVDVTFSNNNSTNSVGGGISNSSVITLTGATLDNNHARYDGGGINSSGTTALINVTLNSNSSAQGGGIINAGGITRLTNVTLSNNTAINGAGIYHISSMGVVTLLKNVIMNQGAQGGNCFVNAAGGNFTTITSQGFNLSDDSSCPHNQPGDQADTNPNLGLLANNGGFTLTQLPRLGSPAIDAGTSLGAPLTDQRGLLRAGAGLAYDIGAVERHPNDQDTNLLYLPLLAR